MIKKPAHEDLEKKISSLQIEISKHKKRETAFWFIQKRLAQIIDSISIPTFVIDNQHKITHYNRAMENLSGISADDIVGTRRQWEVFYSAARPILADLIVDQASEKIIAKHYKGKCQKSPVKKGAYEAEGFFPDIGDNGKWLFFTAAPLMDNDGKVFGAVETLQDITARKRAENAVIRSERHLRTLEDVA
jgi:PAS domain-containing protein